MFILRIMHHRVIARPSEVGCPIAVQPTNVRLNAEDVTAPVAAHFDRASSLVQGLANQTVQVCNLLVLLLHFQYLLFTQCQLPCQSHSA